MNQDRTMSPVEISLIEMLTVVKGSIVTAFATMLVSSGREKARAIMDVKNLVEFALDLEDKLNPKTDVKPE